MKNLDITSIRTERIDWDETKVVDRIVRQYEDLPKAFQKECIQNSWDARLDRREGKEWKIKIYFFKDGNRKTHLIIEDFGTKGMNEKRLDAFLSLWKPAKEHLDAGGQGQGKFVLMGASKENILITETIDEKDCYKCRFLQQGRKNKDGQSMTIENLISGVKTLNHRGTKIWVYNVTKDFLKINISQKFIDSIIESWWQILGDRFNAEIFLFDKKIKIPQLPPFKEELVLLENKQLGNFGVIKRLVLRFHENPIPEIFQGVKVQRANMMIVKIPFDVYEEGYKNRFSGYIEFDDSLESFLKDIEKTNHCGFLCKSPWNEIKNITKERVRKFVDKIIPKKEKRKTFNIKNINQVIQKANQIISENCQDVIGLGSTTVVIPTKKPELLRIKYLTINKREIKYGDIIKPRCCIINETNQNKKISLKVELKREGNRMSKEEYKIKIKDKEQKSIRLSELELKKENYSKGKYTIKVTIGENRHDIDSKTSSFYLETKRDPIKKGFIKGAKIEEIDQPVRNYPINKGVITINFSHRDVINILNSFKQKERKLNEQIGFYIIKICLDEAVNEVLRVKLRNAHRLDLDDDDLVKEMSNLRDRMYNEVYA